MKYFKYRMLEFRVLPISSGQYKVSVYSVSRKTRQTTLRLSFKSNNSVAYDYCNQGDLACHRDAKKMSESRRSFYNEYKSLC